MSVKSDWEISQLIEAGIYPDSDAVLRSALNALFAQHPNQKLDMLASAYQRGEISLGKAAEWMGVSSEETKDLFLRRGVRIHLGPESVEELAQEVDAIEPR